MKSWPFPVWHLSFFFLKLFRSKSSSEKAPVWRYPCTCPLGYSSRWLCWWLWLWLVGWLVGCCWSILGPYSDALESFGPCMLARHSYPHPCSCSSHFYCMTFHQSISHQQSTGYWRLVVFILKWYLRFAVCKSIPHSHRAFLGCLTNLNHAARLPFSNQNTWLLS